MSSIQSRVSLSLLLLRLSVFLVFLMWTLDKLVMPEHAAAIFENFYFIGGLGPTAFYILGILELILIIGFVGNFSITAGEARLQGLQKETKSGLTET